MAGLTLGRRVGESLTISKGAVTHRITVVELRNGGGMRLKIESPKDWAILRDNVNNPRPSNETFKAE